ncbi:MAG: dephospho-CoA kinase [Lysobacterales bacterium CG17_big_fil_post_rev_8_21_14_2_50_64_11]|nr:MAG: dephospho-CoA kinase [Xanthomonadales bacterium CG17_big_fil_post_rev_8_21_14_2_50_64_11]
MANFIVAITGGIASGKSAVGERFAALGVALADADVAARQLVEPGMPALAEIVARFGADICTDDGRLDRRALRARVFADAQARRDLEAILHPRIREQLQCECRQARSAYAMVAIPLLTEVGGRAAYPWLQRIVVVDLPEAMQLARLQARDAISAALAQQMLAAQATRSQRLALADEVIDNSGDLDALDAQVRVLHQRYLQLATASS